MFVIKAQDYTRSESLRFPFRATSYADENPRIYSTVDEKPKDSLLRPLLVNNVLGHKSPTFSLGTPQSSCKVIPDPDRYHFEEDVWATSSLGFWYRGDMFFAPASEPRR